ncbi:peroxisomal acyl-coenzyme A oxidase, partial [Thraustotheca clavata]
QQLTLFPLISMSYGCIFTARRIQISYDDLLQQLNGDINSDQLYLQNQLHTTLSGLKALLTTEVGNGMERARRACGGHGFSSSSNIPHLINVFIGSLTFEGTFDVLVQQHTSSLLKRLHKPVNVRTRDQSMDLFGFLNVDPHETCIASSPSLLLEPPVLLRAFQVRALKTLLQSSHHRTSLHFQSRASMGHAESVLLQCFYDGVLEITDKPLQAVMFQLWQLYALWRMNEHLGEFRMDNYLNAQQASWVQESMLGMLAKIRPNAIPLVDGFGITDFELNSAIGRYDGDIYRALIERAAKEPLNKTDVVE